MKLLIAIWAIALMSCGDIEVKDNQIKDNKATLDTGETDTGQDFYYEYEREYEYERIQVSGSGAKPNGCIKGTPMGEIFAPSYVINTLVNEDDNVDIVLRSCDKAACAPSFAVASDHVVRQIVGLGLISFPSNAKFWLKAEDGIYLPSKDQAGAGSYEVINNRSDTAFLICLRVSAFEHLVEGD